MITSHQLRFGSYKQIIPEFYDLGKILQKSDWHDDTALEHSIQVVQFLEQLIPSYAPLKQRLDNHSRADILLLSGTLHDIGKLKTALITQDKVTFPCHEEVGAEMAKTMLYPFSLSPTEEDNVLKIIRYHGELHNIIKSQEWRTKLTEFGKKVPLLEILLLGFADIRASKGAISRPDDYKIRMTNYDLALDNFR